MSADIQVIPLKCGKRLIQLHLYLLNLKVLFRCFAERKTQLPLAHLTIVQLSTLHKVMKSSRKVAMD